MGLSTRTVVRRLRAWHLGEPLTRGQSIHTATAAASDRLLLAFVKMGGETRPWGMMWKQGTRRAQFCFVPEPRFRAGVDAMVAGLGPVLAEHLRHPAFNSANSSEELAPLRQVWVPNDSHVEMLHHFSYAYARRSLESADANELRLLGRTALFAFLEAQRPGQQVVMSASAVLRSAYDFPAEEVRLAHLGFQLAWLRARGDRDHGLGEALAAERQPVSTALLPELERAELSPLVERYNALRRTANDTELTAVEKEIGTVLQPELERRLGLVQEAIDVVAADPRPVNRGVAILVSESLKSQWWQYVHPEEQALAQGREPFVPSAETDFQARGAAARYFRYDAAADRATAALIHDDHELEAEAISEGRAFRGTIVRVWDEGNGRSTIPILELEDPTPGPLSLRDGDGVCVVGHQKRSGRVREITTTGSGALSLTVEITNRKTKAPDMSWPHSMHAADPLWIGQALTLIGTSFADMTERKAQSVMSSDAAPGDWILGRHDEQDIADETVPLDGELSER